MPPMGNRYLETTKGPPADSLRIKSRRIPGVQHDRRTSYPEPARLAQVGHHRGVQVEPTSTAWVSLD